MDDWWNTGLDILIQWAKLGQGDECQEFCRQLLADRGTRTSANSTAAADFCKANRIVLHAYINQYFNITWDHSTRKPMVLSTLESEQVKAAASAIIKADEILQRMEQQNRIHAVMLLKKVEIMKDDDTMMLKPTNANQRVAPLMSAEDYTDLILAYARLGQVVPALIGLRRIESLYKSSQNNPRLKPSVSVYSPLVKALIASSPKVLYERLGVKYAAYEMAVMVGKDGVEAFRRDKKKPPVHLYNHMLNAYSRVIPPPSSTLTTDNKSNNNHPSLKHTIFVDESIRQKQDQVASGADDVLNQMLQDEVEPNAKTFTALIYTFTKSNWLPEAHAMMEGLMDHLFNASASGVDKLEMVDIRCVRLLANALAKEGAADQVQQIIFYLWALHEKGYYDVEPDIFLYTTALTAWSHVDNSVDHAMALMDDLKQRGLVPDVFTYNALLNVIAKQTDYPDAAEKAGALVVEMQKAKLSPDIVTYNTLMAACLKTTGGQEKADQTLQWMIQIGKPKPDARSYMDLIRAYLPTDMVKAERWLDRMEERFTPPRKLYESLILQWCQVPNQAGRAQALLERMEELYKAQPVLIQGQETLKPKRSLYNAVIRACQNQEKDELAGMVRLARNGLYSDSTVESVKYTSNGQVFALLEKLDQDVGSIDNPAGTTVNFNVMLEYLAKCGEVWAGQRAEDVLNYMLELHLKRGNNAARPNIVTFNKVMAAWAKSSHPDAGDKAVATLSKLNELHKMGLLEDVQADRVTYNTIMNAYAKSEASDSAGMAENFFNELQGRYDATGDEKLQPDIISFTTLLNAYATSRAPGSAKRAEDILLQMNKSYQADHSKVKPNTLCFNEVLFAWANSRDPDSLERAEMVLRLMEDMYDAGNDDVRPSTRSFNIVLLAAASGAKQDASIRAQLFFDRMKESDYIVPDAISYNTLIEAYAKNGGDDTLDSISNLVEEAYNAEGVLLNSIFFSGVISSLSRFGLRGAVAAAEKIVQEIKSKHDDGKLSMTVDTNIYNALINSWAKSAEIDAPIRAEEILTLMESEATNGNNMLKPNVQTYTSVADCWAKSKDPNAAYRAEALLDRMVRYVRPSVRTYTTVIQAFARSQLPDKAVRAQAILTRMKEDFRTNPAAQPTIVAYNALMNACEFTFGDANDIEEAFKVACLAFDEMRSAPDLKLDYITYGSFLGVINELVPKSEMRNEMVRLVFNRCCTDGQLGSLTLKKFKDTAGPSLYRECLTGIRENDLPASWSCNVNEK